ncbi:MAG: hypothetical protein V7742_22405, partial [Halioglobus sp.]
MVPKLTLIIFLALLNMPAFSSPLAVTQFRILPSTINGELSQNSILEVLQSQNGELWISTLDGISRFNGNRLIDYRPSYSGKGHISSVKISKIMEGPAGEVMVATRDQGLLRYDRITDSFVGQELAGHSNQGDKNISTALYSSRGSIWIGYSNGPVIEISSNSVVSRPISLSNDNHVSDFFEQAGGDLWFSTSLGQVYRYSVVDNEVLLVVDRETCISSSIQITEIGVDNNSDLWIGTMGDGLFRVSNGGSVCSRYALPDTNRFQSEISTIFEILIDEGSDNTWIASDQGLYLVQKSGDLSHFHSGNSKLADDEVWSLTPGSNDLLWIGTYTGINLATRTEFETFNQNTHKNLRAIVAIDGSTMRKTWVASYDEILLYDEDSGVHTEISKIFPDIKFKNERVMSLSVSDKEAWIGYRSTGLEHYTFDQHTIKVYSKDSTPSLSSNAISAILPIASGETLIGTYGGGLNIILEEGAVYQATRHDLADKVIMLFEDESGILWVGAESGIQQFDMSRKMFLPLHDQIVGAGWPPERVVLSMAESAEGDIWLGTMHDGLFRLRPSDRSGFAYTSKHYPLRGSRSRDTIYAIEIDDESGIWVSTNLGISRLNAITAEINHFSASSGLIGSEFDVGASHKDSTGRLYFGGSNGYNRFDPKKIDIRSPPPP